MYDILSEAEWRTRIDARDALLKKAERYLRDGMPEIAAGFRRDAAAMTLRLAEADDLRQRRLHGAA